MKFVKTIVDKAKAFRMARQAGELNKLAVHKAQGDVNTYVPPKERARRKKRREMAVQSRRRNRK